MKTVPTKLTATQIANAKSKAEGWPDSNPFKASLLARLGGLHRAPAVTDDRLIMAEEPAVELLRELPAAKSEPATAY